MTVAFLCLKCGEPWGVPPNTHCPTCGPDTPAKVPPEVWELSRVGRWPVYISGHIRSEERLRSIRNEGITHILDVANDPHMAVVWRPRLSQLNELGMERTVVSGLVDRAGVPFDDKALSQAVAALDSEVLGGETVLVHCAAGLRRAPTVVYAWLRTVGYSPDEAWSVILSSRPSVVPHQPYVDGVETWLSGALRRSG